MEPTIGSFVVVRSRRTFGVVTETNPLKVMVFHYIDPSDFVIVNLDDLIVAPFRYKYSDGLDAVLERMLDNGDMEVVFKEAVGQLLDEIDALKKQVEELKKGQEAYLHYKLHQFEKTDKGMLAGCLDD